jgi:uncharacterized RDD family membrane protein YckC
MIKLCMNCHTENALDAVFCSTCGMSLTRAPTAEEGMNRKEAESEHPEQPVAGVEGKRFGIRAGAYLIDTIVTIGTSWAAGFVCGLFLGVAFVIIGREPLFDEEAVGTLDCISGIALALTYFILFEWLFGASPGKLILGMRVVREDGSPCTLSAAIVRGFLRYIDGILFGVVAYASMRNSALQQRLGDKAAHTIVVDRKDSVIQEPREWWWFLIAAVLYCGLVALTVGVELVVGLR